MRSGTNVRLVHPVKYWDMELPTGTEGTVLGTMVDAATVKFLLSKGADPVTTIRFVRDDDCEVIS